MITTAQKQLIQATVPILKEHGVLLTTHFYNRMFRLNPELKHVFNIGNQQNGRQQTALAMAVLAYAENIENPAVLLPAVDRIGHKHTSLDIRPEHYQIVGQHLLASIQEVLGDGATPELIEAWAVAYQQLADIMIGHEARLYARQTEQEGGWTGWRPFMVKEKVVESSVITSFYLYPTDGGKVIAHQPGQYISVRVLLPQLNLFQPRQYSISSAPNNEYYRISVKRERGTSQRVDGMISNHLHDYVKEGDVIEVSAPTGVFTLEPAGDGPLVFISGGVGQTPLLSMLESLLAAGSERSVHWIHGCRDEEAHAFKDTIASWNNAYPSLQTHLFYDQLPEQGAYEPLYAGMVDVHQLPAEVIDQRAAYYLCGPPAFLSKQFRDLTSLGVPVHSIAFEEFGPHVLSVAE